MGDILDDILGNENSVKSANDDADTFENNSLDLYEQLSDPVEQPSPSASKDEETADREDASQGEKEGDWGSGDDNDRNGGAEVGGEELRDGTFSSVTEDSAHADAAATDADAGEESRSYRVDNASHDGNDGNGGTNDIEAGSVGNKRQWGR